MRYDENYDADDRGEIDDELDEICVQIIMALSYLNANKNGYIDGLVSIDKHYLEHDSYLILKTAHMVLNTLRRSAQTGPLFETIEESPFDFAPGVLCLAKVFEREINLSVVHWFRKSLGVELPTYFNKFQPNLRKDHVVFDKVNFNMEKQHLWFPPETGKSLRALLAFRESNKHINLENLDNHWTHLLNESVLSNNWAIIRDERNTAAHNKLVPEKSANAVQSALNELSQKGIFKTLFNMKETFRGNI